MLLIGLDLCSRSKLVFFLHYLAPYIFFFQLLVYRILALHLNFHQILSLGLESNLRQLLIWLAQIMINFLCEFHFQYFRILTVPTVLAWQYGMIKIVVVNTVVNEIHQCLLFINWFEKLNSLEYKFRSLHWIHS